MCIYIIATLELGQGLGNDAETSMLKKSGAISVQFNLYLYLEKR